MWVLTKHQWTFFFSSNLENNFLLTCCMINYHNTNIAFPLPQEQHEFQKPKTDLRSDTTTAGADRIQITALG